MQLFCYTSCMYIRNLILHLSLIEGIGPGTIDTIIKRFQMLDDFAVNVYDFGVQELSAWFGITPKKAQVIVHGLADKDLLEKELSLLEKHTIAWLTILDDSYPYLLKEIHLPPAVLYWQGALLNQEKSIAFVGARKADRYGQECVEHLIPELVHGGWTIVSGGALGLDAMAHQATVDAGGKTIVVLGSGLLNWYPRSNNRLFEDIIKTGGTIVSAFPLRMEGLPGNFPARNRIIAGLSYGCVVVQAAQKSGARITARFALECGREVFAVPGPIGHDLSVGCHELIQLGAKLVTNPDDIVQEFGEHIEPGKKPEIKSHAQMEIKPPKVACSGRESTVLQLCIKPCSVDDLAQQTGLSLDELTDTLFELQLNGLVSQNFTGMWERAK